MVGETRLFPLHSSSHMRVHLLQQVTVVDVYVGIVGQQLRYKYYSDSCAQLPMYMAHGTQHGQVCGT